MTLGNPQEEPSAGKPHARICEGESRMAELLDHSGHFPTWQSVCCRPEAASSSRGYAVRQAPEGATRELRLCFGTLIP